MADERNPYSAPGAKLADPPAQPGSPIKAVLLGLATDLGGSIGATLVLSIVWGAALVAGGTSVEELETLMSSNSTDSAYFYVATLIGLGFSVVGGYVCARIA